LRELLRVTDGLVLLGAPMRSELVSAADRVVFDFIWGKFAEEFQPLRQHVEFGLDSLEQVRERLAAAGATRVVALPCNYVYRWIHQILVFFDLQHRNDERAVFADLNRLYNELLSPHDYREPCYRYLFVVPTDPAFDLDRLEREMRSPPAPPAAVREADGALVEAFRAVDGTAAQRLRELTAENQQLRARVSELEAATLRGRLGRLARGVRRRLAG